MTDYLTIDQEIEATKQIIRNGGKTTEETPLLDELFGVQTDADRVEEAMHKLVRLAKAQERQQAVVQSPDSYDRL